MNRARSTAVGPSPSPGQSQSQGPSQGRHAALIADVAGLIVDVPDFPQPGILFKDLTPVLADPRAFAGVIDWFADLALNDPAGAISAVVGIESRGFLLGAPLALRLGVPLLPVRKAGKLPRAVLTESYELEYGSATLALHADALPTGGPVLIVDDVLATGGTAAAAAALVSRAGGTVTCVAVLLELAALGGRRRLAPCHVHALLAA